MKIQEYKTATGKSAAELDQNVKGLLKDGFEPYGNPYFISQFDAPFCQAMVKGAASLKESGGETIYKGAN